MATVLGVMVAVAIVWLLLGLLARPAHNDKHARDAAEAVVPVPRPRSASPAPGFRTPSFAPAPPAAAVRPPVRATGSRPAAELAALLEAEVSAAEMDRVLGLAAERRIPAELLQRWADKFGVQRMILVIDAGVGESALRRHLRDKTQPDWAALKVFADLARVKGRIAASEPERTTSR